jgi:16S rRNA (guanine966-N2)-methyltransferase
VRIVGGAWRGRALRAPPGEVTRPTADRVRQALFDMLLHAHWGGRSVVEGAVVLDAFAGTGALGLEALSRGAAVATFIERNPVALAALRANITDLDVNDRCTVLAGDALAAPRGASCSLVFLDPPYGRGMVPLALKQLTRQGWLADGTMIVAETARDERLSVETLLSERVHGAARLSVWRASAATSG